MAKRRIRPIATEKTRGANLAPFCSGEDSAGDEEDWEALRGLRAMRGLEEREFGTKEIEGLGIELGVGEEREREAEREGKGARRRGRRRWRKVAEREEEEEKRGNEAVLAVEEREWSAKLSIVNDEGIERESEREIGKLRRDEAEDSM